jgi:hypothetical protein
MSGDQLDELEVTMTTDNRRKWTQSHIVRTVTICLPIMLIGYCVAVAQIAHAQQVGPAGVRARSSAWSTVVRTEFTRMTELDTRIGSGVGLRLDLDAMKGVLITSEAGRDAELEPLVPVVGAFPVSNWVDNDQQIHITVEAASTNTQVLSYVTDQPGFVLLLPPGEYRARVLRSGWRPSIGSIHVHAGDRIVELGLLPAKLTKLMESRGSSLPPIDLVSATSGKHVPDLSSTITQPTVVVVDRLESGLLPDDYGTLDVLRDVASRMQGTPGAAGIALVLIRPADMSMETASKRAKELFVRTRLPNGAGDVYTVSADDCREAWGIRLWPVEILLTRHGKILEELYLAGVEEAMKRHGEHFNLK